MVRRHGFRSFGFNDAYFPVDREAGLDFCERLRAKPWCGEVRWVTETRVDQVDDEVMAAMRSVGLHAIFFGFESGNERILASVGKGTTVAQGREAIRVAHRHGVKVIGFFMVGLPGETRETVLETLRFAMDNDVDIAKFAVTIPYPGSRLFPLLGRSTLSLEECDRFTSWFDWTRGDGGALWAPEGMSPQELVRLQRWCMTRFYLRPAYIAWALRTGLFSPGEMAAGGRIIFSRLAHGVLPSLKLRGRGLGRT